MIASRRGFLLGLGSALAAPAIIPYDRLMPISVPKIICSPKTIGLYDNLGIGVYDDLGKILGIGKAVVRKNPPLGLAVLDLKFKIERLGYATHIHGLSDFIKVPFTLKNYCPVSPGDTLSTFVILS